MAHLVSHAVLAKPSNAQFRNTSHARHAVHSAQLAPALRVGWGKVGRDQPRSTIHRPLAHRARHLARIYADSDAASSSSAEEVRAVPAKPKPTLSASKAFAVAVKEGDKPLSKYVTLPAEKYS
eukprot:3368374-Pyramimonas_sp.AAC.1